MPETPSFADYRAALARQGEHPARVEMRVLDLTLLVSALQLALRHPYFPRAMLPCVRGFVDQAIENLGRLDPVIGATLRAGNDPTQDVQVAPPPAP